MKTLYTKFTGKIDRRSPKSEGKPEDPIMRENWLARDGTLKKPQGTTRFHTKQSTQEDSKTVLLANFNGADGATTYTAETGQVWTRYGTAQLDIAQYKFGTASLLLDGNSDYITFPHSADWYFGNADFTIDFYIRFNAIGVAQTFLSTYDSVSTTFWQITITAANKLEMSFKKADSYAAGGDYIMAVAWSGLATNTWYHLEFARTGTTGKISIDGISQDLTAVNSFDYHDLGDSTTPLVIGTSSGSGANYVNGWIDSVRISKGIARHTENFTSPTTEYSLAGLLPDYCTWMARYHSFETGVISPKTFAYTKDGVLWHYDKDGVATSVRTGLNLNAYPRSWLIKKVNQNYLYLVDGLNLYKHDGNNANTFDKVTVVDSDSNAVKPIDLIEHKDRLCLISKAYLFISANLDFDNFSSSTDSIQIIIGSGKGENLALAKIEDNLYIFNTEGIFILAGDTISALAATFEIDKVDSRAIIAGRSVAQVEGAILFVADDFNLWSFDGSTTQKLSHNEKLDDYINTYRTQLDKMTATYYNNYYMLSFVEKGEAYNNLEVWWDAIENKIDFIRGRNVSCYMQTDPNIETKKMYLGRSDVKTVMLADNSHAFDDVAIQTRLFSRDIVLSKNKNVRITAFYPEFEPTGNRDLTIIYLLDGRITDLDDMAKWTQNLKGEVKSLGFLDFNNQNQFITRVQPKINYATGRSISFYIREETAGLTSSFLGMGIVFIDKAHKKGKLVGQ